MAKGVANPGWKSRAKDSDPTVTKKTKASIVAKGTAAGKRKPIRKQSVFTPADDGFPF